MSDEERAEYERWFDETGQGDAPEADFTWGEEVWRASRERLEKEGDSQ